jgi:hypothetical protein
MILKSQMAFDFTSARLFVAGGFRMRLMLAVCCAVVWGGVACAEGTAGGGAGGLSCAKYAEMYRAANPDHTDNVFGSWTQGFITGANLAREDNVYSDMSAKTFEEMMQFLPSTATITL